MKKLISCVFLLGALLAGAAGPDDFARMRRNFTEAAVANAEARIYRRAEAQAQVKAVLDRIQPDGSLAGIDYGNYSEIRNHLAAMGTIALAYADPAGPCRQNDELKKPFPNCPITGSRAIPAGAARGMPTRSGCRPRWRPP